MAADVIFCGETEPVTGAGDPLGARQSGESERPTRCQQAGCVALRDRRLAGRLPVSKAGRIGDVEKNACVNGPRCFRWPVRKPGEQQA